MLASSKISIIIPTLNSARVLSDCLSSIRSQHYPQNKIQILIIDGGSTDSTLAIAKSHHCQIFKNPLKTAEAGKYIGLQQSDGDYLFFIDSDNILPDQNWISSMLTPFSNSPQIVGAEPFAFTHRLQGGFIERYSALIGANDPLAFFLGIYDRFSYLTNTWTNLKLDSTDHPQYYLIKFNKKDKLLPTIGANGTVFKTEFLKKLKPPGPYLFDIDLIASAPKPLFFVKVKIGIIHSFCESSIKKFFIKQNRRIRDYYFYQKYRTFPWKKINYPQYLFFFFYSTTTFLPLIDACRGYFKIKDTAWFFHPLACLITTYAYTINYLGQLLGISIKTNRSQWRQ